MSSTDETRIYFDTLSNRLQTADLIDKWSEISILFNDLKTNSLVLECGGGTGLYTIPMLKRGYLVTSVDLSEKCLNQIARTAKNLKLDDKLILHAGDFNSYIDIANNHFHVITFIKVLHHFENQLSISEAIIKALDLLLPGGCIIIFEPNGSCPWWYLLLRIRGKDHWEAEKNFRLIKRPFLNSILKKISDKVSWKISYHYFIPGSIQKNFKTLKYFDKLFCSIPILSHISGNIAVVIKKLY